MSESFPREHLEGLWAPWRVEYFEHKETSDPDFLLTAANSTDDEAHFVVARRKTCFLIMNKYPYSAGHLMVVPYRKINQLQDLTEEEMLETWKLCVHAQQLLTICVRAQGFNVGWNIGRAGGAGVDDHLHLHVVPRWIGDSNFMTTISGARVIPEGLTPLYKRLREAQSSLEG